MRGRIGFLTGQVRMFKRTFVHGEAEIRAGSR
jgi:hypothetical protein